MHVAKGNVKETLQYLLSSQVLGWTKQAPLAIPENDGKAPLRSDCLERLKT